MHSEFLVFSLGDVVGWVDLTRHTAVLDLRPTGLAGGSSGSIKKVAKLFFLNLFHSSSFSISLIDNRRTLSIKRTTKLENSW